MEIEATGGERLMTINDLTPVERQLLFLFRLSDALLAPVTNTEEPQDPCANETLEVAM